MGAEIAGLALSLTGLVAAGLVFVPLARGYIRGIRRAGGDGLGYGGGGKPTRLPTSEGAMELAAMMDDDGTEAGGEEGGAKMGLRAMYGRGGGGGGTAAVTVAAAGLQEVGEEGGDGWTTQTAVSPERAGNDDDDANVGGGGAAHAFLGRRGASTPDGREDSGEEEAPAEVLQPSVYRGSDVPRGLEEPDHFRFKNIDL